MSALTPGSPLLEYRVAEFSPREYDNGVERLIQAFEAERGEAIAPGSRGKAALKIYTGSGPGLATPAGLVRAVARSLERRGYAREDIFLVDLSETRLRRSGFLPAPTEGGETFEGHPVIVLESGRYFDEKWFYENPLPPRRESGLSVQGRGPGLEARAEDRLSHLPMPLIHEVDFWINLPVYSDHAVLGVNGALVNATLWNAGNTLRFFQSKANGPVAVAEIAAVPELGDGWLFSLVSLEKYQFVGGPAFHSLYTASEPVLILGADPVSLDAEMIRRVNRRRSEQKFEPLDEEPPQLEYAQQLDLGRARVELKRLATGAAPARAVADAEAEEAAR